MTHRDILLVGTKKTDAFHRNQTQLIADTDGDIVPAQQALPCDGDLNGDGIVDGVDLAEVLGSWGQSDVPADIDGSGQVDGADLAAILGNWGFCQ